MRFLVDQNLPPTLAAALEKIGHEASHTELIGLGEVDDGSIIDHALATGSVIITKDSDFNLIAPHRDPMPQILWIRLKNPSTQELKRVLTERWPDIESSLESGTTIVEVS